MKIVHVVGARPNFIKAAPVYQACARRGVAQTIVHTGQHYDEKMSGVFFQELGLPCPDVNLEVGSGSHAEQTAKVMLRFEPVVLDARPDWVTVYGDVNSTIAAALVCSKLSIPVAHVEAGLRSFDRRMPEEINRLLTDQIADLLFIPSKDAQVNLLREGISTDKIRFVGNVMIDTLVKFLTLAQEIDRSQYPSHYALVTLHRPSNVDDPVTLTKILESLLRISRKLPVVFSVHPRTRKQIDTLGLSVNTPDLHLVEPLSYLEFLALEQHATVVLTDSGGIQEETTFLGAPCLTLRENTERPITISLGTNMLVGSDYARLEQEVDAILAGKAKKGQIPPLWDGQAAERIADILERIYSHRKAFS
jgi:UDP-N-acetylglucosamine 2-epimerase (non-hydrolysing)